MEIKFLSVSGNYGLPLKEEMAPLRPLVSHGFSPQVLP